MRISAALVKAVKNGADARFCENVAKRLEILTLTTQEGIDDAARRVAGCSTNRGPVRGFVGTESLTWRPSILPNGRGARYHGSCPFALPTALTARNG